MVAVKTNAGDAWLSVNDKFGKATRCFLCRDSDAPVCDFEGDPEVSVFDLGFGRVADVTLFPGALPDLAGPGPKPSVEVTLTGLWCRYSSRRL